MWLTRKLPTTRRLGVLFITTSQQQQQQRTTTSILRLPPPPLTARDCCCGGGGRSSSWFFFSTTAASSRKYQYPPRLSPPPDDEITEVYLKGSGPGGQKINKTSSAVQLKHLPTGIVIKCQETRSRSQNRKLARTHLAEKIDDLLNGDNSRSAQIARIQARKKASALKKSRRKHRAEGGREGSDGGEDDGEVEEGDVAEEMLPDPTIQKSSTKEP